MLRKKINLEICQRSNMKLATCRRPRNCRNSSHVSHSRKRIHVLAVGN